MIVLGMLYLVIVSFKSFEHSIIAVSNVPTDHDCIADCKPKWDNITNATST